ncbi:MAG: hypothetical protein HYT71_00435 [Candidatus Aenigmarchaeota archaeon]|nr:hypothetical protein [Candidatus Aenigmarchaeota archaeon]
MYANYKGQFTVEFIMAVVSFIIIVVYAMNFASNEMTPFSSQHNSNIIQARAYQISEFLIFDDGSWDGLPADFANENPNPLNPARIGLGNGYHILNGTKIKYLNTLCSSEAGYSRILSKLNINNHVPVESFKDFKSYLLSENRCVDISIYDPYSQLVSCPPKAESENWECVKSKTSATERLQIVRYSLNDAGEIINMTVGVW